MAAIDPVKNFGLVTVSTTYNAGDTVIQLSAGEAAKLPDPAVDGEYDVTWWDATDYANPSLDPNREIVRVTGMSFDQITVIRGQQGTSDSSKSTVGHTYMISRSITKKDWDELQHFMKLPAGSDAVIAYDLQSNIASITHGSRVFNYVRKQDGELESVDFDGSSLTFNKDQLGRVTSFNIT